MRNASYQTIKDNLLKYSLQLKVSELESQILKQSEVLERAQVQIVRWDFSSKKLNFTNQAQAQTFRCIFFKEAKLYSFDL